jgi:capsule polysaccharide export protein KpsE/RkpR
LVTSTNTSSAHQERIFIEKRMHGVQDDLQKAQQQLSEFSSTHSTVDIKEQARAMVDAASRLQAQLIVEQSGLDSLRQTYGDGNVRIRSAQARIAELQAQIAKMGGSSKALSADDNGRANADDAASRNENLYPPLRQLPRLAVPYANLYREVQVQEAVYELLTQQYELARIQEAKDVPVVSVIDAPGIPEKKSFPPRLLLSLLITAISAVVTSALILAKQQWLQVPVNDPRKALALEIGKSVQARLKSSLTRERGAQ